MKIKPQRYAESLLALCKGRSTAQIDLCVKEFLTLLAHRGVSRLGYSILESLRDGVARQSGNSRVTVISAHELEKIERESFEKMIHESFGKKSSIDFNVNPQLMSGFKIKTGDTIVDASLSGRLHTLRDYLKQPALVE